MLGRPRACRQLAMQPEEPNSLPGPWFLDLKLQVTVAPAAGCGDSGVLRGPRVTVAPAAGPSYRTPLIPLRLLRAPWGDLIRRRVPGSPPCCVPSPTPAACPPPAPTDPSLAKTLVTLLFFLRCHSQPGRARLLRFLGHPHLPSSLAPTQWASDCPPAEVWPQCCGQRESGRQKPQPLSSGSNSPPITAPSESSSGPRALHCLPRPAPHS